MSIRAAATALGPRPRTAAVASAYRIYLPWLACIGLLVVTGLFITFVGGGLENHPYRFLFEPTMVAIVAVAGGVGVHLASRTGFPAAWDRRVNTRMRFGYPLAIGAVFGVVAIVLDLTTGSIAFILDVTGGDRFNAPFPASILLYSGGAVVLEVIYRLLAIPVVLWIAFQLGLPERYRLISFVILAVLTSLIEPLSQAEVAFEAGRYDLAYSQFALAFAGNLAQAYFFLRAGFLAAISVRLGNYAVWHVLYGGLICVC